MGCNRFRCMYMYLQIPKAFYIFTRALYITCQMIPDVDSALCLCKVRVQIVGNMSAAMAPSGTTDIQC